MEHNPPARAVHGPVRRWAGRLVVLALIAGAAIVAAYYLAPRVRLALTTVSTDDAYVNAHVTHVAPRIAENVLAVRVDDEDFVRKGDLLVRLDDATWTIRLSQARAARDVAVRSREQAVAKARSAVSAARANRFKLASAMTEVRNQVAGLRVAVARWNEAKAAERLARTESERYATLAKRGSVTQEQADVRRTDAEQAEARVRQALESIHQARAGLELPEEPEKGHDLGEVTPDLDQRHSAVLSALGSLALNLADLGVELPSYYETPDEFIASIKARAPGGDLDALIAQTVKQAPNVLAAEAQVEQAGAQLREAELNLSYCAIRADIDGFVSNRGVNPGDRVAQGQRLMAIRSFQEVWIDCNFKETQLEPIRIGQPVDITVDAYPGQVFRGRVRGFSPGTGAATALLPAQNATGNFVKIVQRLPVRVDLVGGNPPDTPLFVGLSAEPRIRIYDKPEGPNAGQRLRGAFPAVPTRPRRASPPPPPTASSRASAGSTPGP